MKGVSFFKRTPSCGFSPCFCRNFKHISQSFDEWRRIRRIMRGSRRCCIEKMRNKMRDIEFSRLFVIFAASGLYILWFIYGLNTRYEYTICLNGFIISFPRQANLLRVRKTKIFRRSPIVSVEWVQTANFSSSGRVTNTIKLQRDLIH